MEQFKIEHFERDRPGEPFPKFEPLGTAERAHIGKQLARKVGLDESVEPLALINSLLNASHWVEGFDATSEGFDLSLAAEQFGLRPEPDIYINWDRFSRVDRMQFADLSKYFHDIWYPSADDIEVFDNTLSWILFIHHSGSIGLAQFTKSKA